MTMTNDDGIQTAVKLQPYFESAAEGACGLDGSCYVAGFVARRESVGGLVFHWRQRLSSVSYWPAPT